MAEYGQGSEMEPILSHRSGKAHKPSKLRAFHRKTKSVEPRDVKDASERLERFMQRENRIAMLKFEQVEQEMRAKGLPTGKEKKINVK